MEAEWEADNYGAGPSIAVLPRHSETRNPMRPRLPRSIREALVTTFPMGDSLGQPEGFGPVRAGHATVEAMPFLNRVAYILRGRAGHASIDEFEGHPGYPWPIEQYDEVDPIDQVDQPEQPERFAVQKAMDNTNIHDLQFIDPAILQIMDNDPHRPADPTTNTNLQRDRFLPDLAEHYTEEGSQPSTDDLEDRYPLSPLDDEYVPYPYPVSRSILEKAKKARKAKTQKKFVSWDDAVAAKEPEAQEIPEAPEDPEQLQKLAKTIKPKKSAKLKSVKLKKPERKGPAKPGKPRRIYQGGKKKKTVYAWPGISAGPRCTRCDKDHAGCDRALPCGRCKAHNWADSCDCKPTGMSKIPAVDKDEQKKGESDSSSLSSHTLSGDDTMLAEGSMPDKEFGEFDETDLNAPTLSNRERANSNDPEEVENPASSSSSESVEDTTEDPDFLGRPSVLKGKPGIYKCRGCKLEMKVSKKEAKAHAASCSKMPKCGFCNRQFKYRSDWKRHVPLCDKTVQKEGTNYQLKNFSTGMYHCRGCNKQFMRKSECSMHEREECPLPFECYKCKRSFEGTRSSKPVQIRNRHWGLCKALSAEEKDAGDNDEGSDNEDSDNNGGPHNTNTPKKSVSVMKRNVWGQLVSVVVNRATCSESLSDKSAVVAETQKRDPAMAAILLHSPVPALGNGCRGCGRMKTAGHSFLALHERICKAFIERQAKDPEAYPVRPSLPDISSPFASVSTSSNKMDSRGNAATRKRQMTAALGEDPDSSMPRAKSLRKASSGMYQSTSRDLASSARSMGRMVSNIRHGSNSPATGQGATHNGFVNRLLGGVMSTDEMTGTRRGSETIVNRNPAAQSDEPLQTADTTPVPVRRSSRVRDNSSSAQKSAAEDYDSDYELSPRFLARKR